MKTYILSKWFCVIMLFVGISISCTELKDDSYGNVVSAQYNPQTEADISYLINAAYVAWRETMLLWNGVVRGQELCADQDIIPARGNGWVDGGIYKRWHQHNWTTDDDSAWQPWTRTYMGINTCNRLLSQIEDGAIGVEGEAKVRLVSELKVLRASYYYILVDFFGNVPLVTDFKDLSLPQQSTRVEVFDFIVTEITDNVDNLSETSRGYYYGRFNKWAAYTLLAKMYLNAEVWTGTAHWADCIAACNEIIGFAESTGEYALEDNQKDVFITNNENSKEIIFALPFDEIYVTDWNAFDFHLYTLASENQATYNFTNVPWGGVCVIPQFIDSFDPDDARLKENFISGQQYTASGEILNRSDNGEPLVYGKEVPSVDYSTNYDGYRWGKFEYAMGITNRLSNDWPLFRYADILLMKAEALMRDNKPGAGALVTRVRERVFKSNPVKAAISDVDLLTGCVYDYGRRDTDETTHEGGFDIQYGRFLDELGWEFTQEGRRRQDMIRFGVFTTKSWFSHSTSSNYRNLYPIPNQAILTNSNLNQNPGY
ncbi:MAG: RagB/SusD family nutrient uptake outer membrane protein [Labilibaculum sp.]|nr:RagB/SusD family nutrient uptake outer membrane protein [Labilibaculum sp.]